MLARQSKEITAYIQEIRDPLGDEENKDMKGATNLDLGRLLPKPSITQAEEGALFFLGMPWPQQIFLCTELERLKPKHDASLKQKGVSILFTHFIKPPSHSFISDVTVDSFSLLDKT